MSGGPERRSSEHADATFIKLDITASVHRRIHPIMTIGGTPDNALLRLAFAGRWEPLTLPPARASASED